MKNQPTLPFAVRPEVRSRLAMLVVAASTILGGCGNHPLRPPSTALPSTFAGFGAGAPGNAGEASGGLDHWWTLFADPQLTSFVEQALTSAPDAKRALAVLAEARANRAEALTRYDPQGSISAQASRQHSSVSGAGAAVAGGSGMSNNYTSSFEPSWELDVFGRARASKKAAEGDFAAARFEYEASRQSLAAAVAVDLFTARGLAVQTDDAREAVRIAGQLADFGQRRAALGLGSRVDAASLAADLAAAESTLNADQAQLDIAKRSLLVLLGRGIEPLAALAVAPSLGDLPPVPSTTPGQLLARRPDVREAEARVQSAAGNLRLDELALLPTFNLLPAVSAASVSGPFGYSSLIESVAGGLSMPLLNEPRLLAEIRAGHARGEQAVIAYEKSVQTAYGEAENQLTQLASDRTRLTELSVAERSSLFAFNAQQAGYRAGIVDLTTLLTSERSWRNDRSALSALRASALTDMVNTFKALGGGWSPSPAVSAANSAQEDKS
jgi:NodT family efflux transporter outer membrane factor (OMF) lipoprotein